MRVKDEQEMAQWIEKEEVTEEGKQQSFQVSLIIEIGRKLKLTNYLRKAFCKW